MNLNEQKACYLKLREENMGQARLLGETLSEGLIAPLDAYIGLARVVANLNEISLHLSELESEEDYHESLKSEQ